jgi:DNA-binding NarL/FixJ family response regulator
MIFKANSPIRVYVVDDHPIMRSGVAQLISLESDMVVVGEAADAVSAFTGILDTKPDIVVVDISLPGKNGLELIKDIRSAEKSVAILVHSMHDENLYVERALRAGAQGYLDKQEGGEKLIEAIRTVLFGEIYVSSSMSSKLIDVFSNRKTPTSDPIEGLSDRQFEIFQMIGRGKGTRAVAAELGVSVKTVDAHRANIKEKLRLGSGNELVRYAVRWIESQNQP